MIDIQNLRDLLAEHGWQPAGHTQSETVRIATVKSPVFGGIGGELATFGGRERWAKGELRVTIGPRTVNFYKAAPRGQRPTGFTNFKTKDFDSIRNHVEASR